MKYVGKPLKESRSTISIDGTVKKHIFNKKSQPEEMIHAVWSTWCNITKRPDSESTLTDDIKEKIDSHMNIWYNQSVSVVNYFVRAALYIPPVKQDYDDIQRMLKCLSNKSVRKQAVDNMNSLSAYPYYWKNPKDVNNRIQEIINMLDIVTFDELSDKEQSSLIALATISKNEFEVLYNRALDIYDEDKILTPTDILTVEQRGGIKVKVKTRNSGTGSSEKSYEAGRREDAQLFGDETIEYDIYAMELVMNGYDMKNILSYHNDMPRGYWREVENIVNDTGNTDMEEIYFILQTKYRTHPAERNTPDRV